MVKLSKSIKDRRICKTPLKELIDRIVTDFGGEKKTQDITLNPNS